MILTQDDAPQSAQPAQNLCWVGPPGTGKTRQMMQRAASLLGADASEASARALQRAGRLVMVAFHQAYSYEDFVEGLRPVDAADGALRYARVPGPLLRIAREATAAYLSDPAKPLSYALLIDELNRGNVARIFGEVLSAMEPSRRLGEPSELRLSLPLAGPDEAPLVLPPNLHILATLNSADRATVQLDAALRRRFEFITLAPSPAALITHHDAPISWLSAALLETINLRVAALLGEGAMLGHAALLEARSLPELRDALVTQLIPQLRDALREDDARLAMILGCGRDDAGQPSRREPHAMRLSDYSAPMLLATTSATHALFGEQEHGADALTRYTLHPTLCESDDPATLLPFIQSVLPHPSALARIRSPWPDYADAIERAHAMLSSAHTRDVTRAARATVSYAWDDRAFQREVHARLGHDDLGRDEVLRLLQRLVREANRVFYDDQAHARAVFLEQTHPDAPQAWLISLDASGALGLDISRTRIPAQVTRALVTGALGAPQLEARDGALWLGLSQWRQQPDQIIRLIGALSLWQPT